MAAFLQRRWVRITRAIFRWIRISVWFVLFLGVFAFVYLQLIGLPDLLKEPLLRNLRAHGFDAQFSNARLDWGHVILIENATFQHADQPLGPRLSASRAELNLNLAALIRRRMNVDSLKVSNGRLQLPFSPAKDDFLSLDDVQLGVRLLPGDVAQIMTARGVFHGIQIQIAGGATNVTALRDWKVFHPSGKTNQNYQVRLRQFADTLQRIHFSAPPELHVELSVDGRDPDSLAAAARIEVPGVQTPWGDASGFKLTAACERLFNPGERPFLQTHLSAASVATPWARGGAMSLTAAISRDLSSNFNATINFEGAELRREWTSATGSNEWIHAAELRWDGAAECAATNFIPYTATGELRASGVESRLGSIKQIHLGLQTSTTTNAPEADPSWGLWAGAEPYAVNCQGEAEEISTPKLELESARFACQWLAPELVVKTIEAKLYGKQLAGAGQLNVLTREVRFKAESNFDPHRIAPLLLPTAQRFLDQYSWETPPNIQAQVRLVLPSWTNRQPDWHGEILPTLQIAGHFSVTNGAFRGVPASYAQSDFSYTNRVWNVPRLHAIRPEGGVYMDYTGNELTHDFKFTIDSEIDPKILLPMIDAPWKTNFDQVTFSAPPSVHADIWGRWHDRERVGFLANFTVTNITARGEHVDELAATAEYTNKMLRVTHLQAFQGKGLLTAAEIDADLDTKKITLTNIDSTLDTAVVPRVLGERGPKFFHELGFTVPPKVHLDGAFVLRDPMGTDLHFDVAGDHFYWTNLAANHISGHVDWRAREVALTNVQASIYGAGTLAGSGVFDYQPKMGTDFRGHAIVRDVDLHLLAAGVSGKTNRLEGKLDGEAFIDRGNTSNRKSWNGHGYAIVHDGLLWDFKVFGLFTPILNSIKDGLGSSRASQANCTFIITNGAVFTSDMEVHSISFRLLYRGSIDADKQINARVEAQLLRNAWVVGPLLGAVLSPFSKAFEFKITGPVNNPVKEPVFIPKILANMIGGFIHPIHTLEKLSPSDENVPVTPQQGSPKEQK